MVETTYVRTIGGLNGATYIRKEDVVELIREVADSQATDARDALYELALSVSEMEHGK